MKLILSLENWTFLFMAWVIVLASSMGVVFIGEIMGQTPCVLCWYQRGFMFSLAVILGLATWRNDIGIWVYGVGLAALGWLFAAYHTLLFFKLIPEPIKPCAATGPSCSGNEMVIFGIPIPLLSVIVFTLIAVLLLALRRRTK